MLKKLFIVFLRGNTLICPRQASMANHMQSINRSVTPSALMNFHRQFALDTLIKFNLSLRFAHSFFFYSAFTHREISCYVLMLKTN